MSATELHIRLRINFPVIFFTVLFVHAFLLALRGLPKFDFHSKTTEAPAPLKIRRIKNLARADGFLKTDLPLPTKVSSPNLQPKKDLSLKDLSASKSPLPAKIPRPGSRPGVLPEKPKAINAISLKGREFQDFAKSFPAGGVNLKQLDSSGQLSDALVSLEVPDGVEPDELNKYELMFYSFQRRTALAYAGSIIRQLNKFMRENPHFRWNEDALMTARMTFDEKGNVKQIKMIRWSNNDKLQNFFEDVVKGIDQLHNPPKSLWEKSGEFAMFFTLEVNG
jgi:hypothetical protein